MQLKEGLKIKLEKFESLKHLKLKWIILGVVGFILLSLIITAFFLSNSILGNPYVYTGVYIDGVSVGGMSQDDVKAYLDERYRGLLTRLKLTLFSDTYEKVFTLDDLGIYLDVEGMKQTAYNAGRTGAFTSRLVEISRLRKYPLTIPLVFKYDEDKLETVLEDINRMFSKDPTVPKVVIQGDRVVLFTGITGQVVDKEVLRSKIMSALNLLQSEYIHIPTTTIALPKIDVDATYNAILQDPADAIVIKTKEGKAQIQPHVNGRRIDKVALKEIIERVENREHQFLEEIELPVDLIEPNVTTEELTSLVFRDILGSFTTAFQTNSENAINRGVNIRLASKAIDGTILLPGEEFSFNGVVGPRTREKGYVIAHIYSEGEVRDGYGGGICQVSTTLYDAALRANLPVTERHNHVFTVSYVKPGLDAAVSYDYADLKFKNNTSYPVRINAKVTEDNKVTFSISGTNLYPDVRVELISKVISTTKVSTVYVDDPTMAFGTEAVEENGMDGAVVETYIKLYSGKTVVNEYMLHSSTYQMLPRKVRRGTAVQ